MRWLIAVAILLSSLTSPAALSAQQGKGKAKGNGHGKDQSTQVAVVFSATQREAVRGYFVEKHGHGNCPPGLAKKNNGCLPPGQAKKRYAVGRSLPRGIVVTDLPAELSVKIGRAPEGYRYGILDGDLVKLAVGTMLVVDAIEGLVR